MKKIHIIIICLTILTAQSFAQVKDDFIRPFFGFYDSQSITAAIGRATVASGQVIPGQTSNPANLGLHRFNSIHTTFQNGSFKGSSQDQSFTKFGGIYAISPIPVFQGSMVLGYGITRSLDFTDASQGENFLKTEEGGLYLTQLAFAVEIYKDFFVGVDIKYYQGNDKSTEIGEEITQHLNPKYSGIGTSIGFVERLYKSFLIGASVDLPTYIWTSEKYTDWENGSH